MNGTPQGPRAHVDPGPGVLPSNQRIINAYLLISNLRLVFGMGSLLGFDWVQVTCVLRDWYHIDLDPDLHRGLKIMEAEMMAIDAEDREKKKGKAHG